ncbi:unnamed protein product [Bursaphelenchus okinawaensis]|uniref:Uncharacterized protein n=1 Tax=Bursaphelenchus okinawaensis TaxID=465554 RepID=A0A811KZE0_9BILA|nr:unnamed protein product [Bursaphelenchus okinawaensis]CAG9115049.1 unnamed protein product [Bursaphelenchus okinawaensis]
MTMSKKLLDAKVPLKEDDNQDLAWLNMNLKWPLMFNYIWFFGLSMVGLFMPSFTSRSPFEKFDFFKQLAYSFGKEWGFCHNAEAAVPSQYLSLLRHTALYVWNNVSLRLACCLSMPFRMGNCFVIHKELYYILLRHNCVYQILNHFCLACSLLDVTSITLLSCIHIILDSPLAYKIVFTIWIISSALSFCSNAMLVTFIRIESSVDKLIFVIKTACCVMFVWQAGFLYHFHKTFVDSPSCHSYVKFDVVLAEYAVFISYYTFELTKLYDVKDCRLIIYPRTSTGECTKLVPQNFDGGVFTGAEDWPY